MYTLILEIKTNTKPIFYNPAITDTKAYPRTKNGIEKAIKKFSNWIVKNSNTVTDAQIVLYEGKFEYWKKEMKPMGIYKLY